MATSDSAAGAAAAGQAYEAKEAGVRHKITNFIATRRQARADRRVRRAAEPKWIRDFDRYYPPVRLQGTLDVDWSDSVMTGQAGDAFVAMAPTTAGFVIHVRNSGPNVNTEFARFQEMATEQWVAYDGTPDDSDRGDHDDDQRTPDETR